jgi:hypothetical protein
MLEIRENNEQAWLSDKPLKKTLTQNREEIYAFTSAYGPVSITVFTTQPNQVTWNKNKVTCRNGIVFIDYPIDKKYISFEINPSLEQVFEIHQGKIFFSVTSKAYLFKEIV